MGAIYNAIVLNEPYAEWVAIQKKQIETRMRLLKLLRGEIVICCDGTKSKHSDNAGKALCIVTVKPGRAMTDQDEELACIENIPGRYAYELSDWLYFSRNFKFSERKIHGDFRGVFKLELPNDITLKI